MVLKFYTNLICSKTIADKLAVFRRFWIYSHSYFHCTTFIIYSGWLISFELLVCSIRQQNRERARERTKENVNSWSQSSHYSYLNDTIAFRMRLKYQTFALSLSFSVLAAASECFLHFSIRFRWPRAIMAIVHPNWLNVHFKSHTNPFK